MRLLIAFLAFASLVSGAGFVPKFVQSSTPAANTLSSSSSSTFTVNAPTRKGNSLFLWVLINSSTAGTTDPVSSVSMTGVSWNSISTNPYQHGGTSTRVVGFHETWGAVTSPGATSLTLNFNTTYTGSVMIVLAEDQGYPLNGQQGGPDCIDNGTNTATATPSAFCQFSPAPLQLALAFVAVAYGTSAAVTTQPSGWTALTQVNNGVVALQVNYNPTYGPQGGTNPYPTATWVIPGTVRQCLAYIAVSVQNFSPPVAF